MIDTLSNAVLRLEQYMVDNRIMYNSIPLDEFLRRLRIDIIELTGYSDDTIDELMGIALNLYMGTQLVTNCVRRVAEMYANHFRMTISQLQGNGTAREFTDVRKIILWTLVNRHNVPKNIAGALVGINTYAGVRDAIYQFNNLYITDLPFRRTCLEFFVKNYIQKPILK
jgi:hypothetical protein